MGGAFDLAALPMIRLDQDRLLRPLLRFIAALAALSAAACNTVEFHERRLLGDRAMQGADGETETHFLQKVRYSDEGAAGGIGTGAGGGCGCY